MNLLLCLLLAVSHEPNDIYVRFDEYDQVDQVWKSRLEQDLKRNPTRHNIHISEGRLGYKVGSKYESWIDLPRDAVPEPTFWNRFIDFNHSDYHYDLDLSDWKITCDEIGYESWRRFTDHLSEFLTKKEGKICYFGWLDSNDNISYYCGGEYKEINIRELSYTPPPAIAIPSPPQKLPNPMEYLLIWR
jgi:hypothetical protein